MLFSNCAGLNCRQLYWRDEWKLKHCATRNWPRGIIAAGDLQPGERLPSVRRLSRERRLSVSTVLQALHQLEDRGLVEARP